MDPATAITTVVGAASAVTIMYTTIKKTRAEGREQKIKNLAEEKLAFAESDSEILRLIQQEKCEGIGNAKEFKKLMNEVFKRHPEQEIILGKKVQKCYDMAKKSKR